MVILSFQCGLDDGVNRRSYLNVCEYDKEEYLSGHWSGKYSKELKGMDLWWKTRFSNLLGKTWVFQGGRTLTTCE